VPTRRSRDRAVHKPPMQPLSGPALPPGPTSLSCPASPSSLPESLDSLPRPSLTSVVMSSPSMYAVPLEGCMKPVSMLMDVDLPAVAMRSWAVGPVRSVTRTKTTVATKQYAQSLGPGRTPFPPRPSPSHQGPGTGRCSQPLRWAPSLHTLRSPAPHNPLPSLPLATPLPAQAAALTRSVGAQQPKALAPLDGQRKRADRHLRGRSGAWEMKRLLSEPGERRLECPTVVRPRSPKGAASLGICGWVDTYQSACSGLPTTPAAS
jgi:hypothetical protein